MGDIATHTQVRVPSLPYDGKDEAWTGWKLRFTSWMKRISVYDVMTGDGQRPREAAARATYDYKNQTAYTYIITNITETAFNTVAQAPEDDGRAAWGLLLNRYETKSRAQKINLLSELIQDPEELFTKINNIIKQLSYWENLKHIDDEWLIGITVNALPEAYKELVTVLDNEEELTFEETKNKIRSFRARRILRERELQGAESAFYAKKIKCYKCHKLGHIASECATSKIAALKWCKLHKTTSHSDAECKTQHGAEAGQSNMGF
jgi:gag-polypeptide of LTR copia-type/Zinc knuckle